MPLGDDPQWPWTEKAQLDRKHLALQVQARMPSELVPVLPHCTRSQSFLVFGHPSPIQRPFFLAAQAAVAAGPGREGEPCGLLRHCPTLSKWPEMNILFSDFHKKLTHFRKVPMTPQPEMLCVRICWIFLLD